MISTVIVLVGWLVAAVWFSLRSIQSLRSGVAPWQIVLRLLGRPLITRADAPFAYWYMTIPTVAGAVFFTLGVIVLVAAVLGVFGPLGP